MADDTRVVRVVDGDTVDVKVDGEIQRIRLLNIDTPETVDPSQPEECLGAEATAYTKTLLKPGQKVDLVYDVDRTDRYGRTLAHVILENGHAVSDLIARQGLGIPVVFGANDGRISEVKAEFAKASDDELGFFDPNEDCTLAAQLAQASQQATEATSAGAGTTSAEAATAAAALLAVVEAQAGLRTLLGTFERSTSLTVRAFVKAGRSAELVSARSALAQIEVDRVKMVKLTVDRQAAERAKAAAAKKLAQEKAAKAAAAKAAREEAARDAARAAARAEARRRSSSPRHSSAPRHSSGGSSNPPGYTGPRCYEPGGKVWHPC